MNNKELAKQIANTIWKQIMSQGGTAVVASWGTHALQFLSGEQLEEMGMGKHLSAALKFKVQGRLFNGHVVVALDEGRDTYEVHYGRMRYDSKIGKVSFSSKMEAVKNVYWEDLAQLIDEAVETPDKGCA